MDRIVSSRTAVSAAALLVILAWTAAAAEPAQPQFATGRDERPADSGFIAPPIGFDCSRAETTLTVAIGSVDTLRNDTTDAEGELPGYACFGWDESGPEQIYELEVTERLVVYAGLSDLEADLDVFLLNDCDTDSCIGYANTEFAILVPPGTYYLVVDGYQGAVGPYTLAVSGHYLGVPEEICDPESDLAAIPIDWPLAAARSDTLFGRPNLIQAYNCNLVLRTGGEVWYAVTLEAGWQLDADVVDVPTGLDPCLWLFDGCGASPLCLDFVDVGGAGVAESLTWHNDTDATVTVYLAIDSWRAPESLFDGVVTLSAPLLPVERTSWGGLQKRYR